MIDRRHATRAADQNEAYETEYSMLPIPTHFLYLVQTYYKILYVIVHERLTAHTPQLRFFPTQYNIITEVSLSPSFPFSQGSPLPLYPFLSSSTLHSHKTSSFQHSLLSPHYTETSLPPSLPLPPPPILTCMASSFPPLPHSLLSL